MPTVNNERVSQLVALSATEISADDIFFIGDVSARQSKRLPAGELLTYVNVSSSINALTSKNADTASYVLGTNVHGTVSSASLAASVVSASYALVSNQSVTASYALASQAIVTVATASYLSYQGFNNGTASFALTASLASNVKTASYIQYTIGVDNGTIVNALTASFISSASFANRTLTSVTSSFSSNAQLASSSVNSATASFINPLFVYGNTPVKAWAWVTWSLGVTQPKIIEQYNVDSITYLNQFFAPTTTAYYATWSQFGVSFGASLQNTRYMLMGDGYQPFGDPERAGVMMHPYYNSRSLNGFTMSVITQGQDNFYLGVPGAYGTDEYGFVTFQVIGW